MAFEGLSDKLQGVFKKLKGNGILTEENINEAMREIKLALLEADVNFKIVKEFVNSVKEKSLGEEVHASLNPAQQVIKIVNDELTALMAFLRFWQQKNTGLEANFLAVKTGVMPVPSFGRYQYSILGFSCHRRGVCHLSCHFFGQYGS